MTVLGDVLERNNSDRYPSKSARCGKYILFDQRVHIPGIPMTKVVRTMSGFSANSQTG